MIRTDEDDFSELEYGAKDLEPISLEERRARVARLAQLLGDSEADAFLCEPGTTLRYLTGIQGRKSERLFGLVVFADGSLLWVAPSFEVERMTRLVADGPGGEMLGWAEHEYPFRPLVSAMAEKQAQRIAIEPELRHVFAAGLGRELGTDNVVFGGPLTEALRGVKDDHELAILRRANELTVRAFSSMEERVVPGLTAAQVGGMMTRAQEKLGLSSIWNLTLVGARAAEPHGGTDNTPIEKGDVLLIDSGGTLFGYQSDNTRTWVVGAKPTEEVTKVWNVVRDAQLAAMEAIGPGKECRNVDVVAREIVGAAGYGRGYANFTHRLGHGIGMDGHEGPYFDGGSQVLMTPGMTFSNEPGIYLRERFGVRLENIVAVTEEGAECFGGWQKGPDSPV